MGELGATGQVEVKFIKAAGPSTDGAAGICEAPGSGGR